MVVIRNTKFERNQSTNTCFTAFFERPRTRSHAITHSTFFRSKIYLTYKMLEFLFEINDRAEKKIKYIANMNCQFHMIKSKEISFYVS